MCVNLSILPFLWSSISQSRGILVIKICLVLGLTVTIKLTSLLETVDTEPYVSIPVTYTLNGVDGTFEAVGNGPIDAVKRGLVERFGLDIKLLDYEEHALQSGSNSQAAAYIHILDMENGKVTYGVGVSSNITRASVRGIFSAINRLELVK